MRGLRQQQASDGRTGWAMVGGCWRWTAFLGAAKRTFEGRSLVCARTPRNLAPPDQSWRLVRHCLALAGFWRALVGFSGLWLAGLPFRLAGRGCCAAPLPSPCKSLPVAQSPEQATLQRPMGHVLHDHRRSSGGTMAGFTGASASSRWHAPCVCVCAPGTFSYQPAYQRHCQNRPGRRGSTQLGCWSTGAPELPELQPELLEPL